jgi:hypothetical protein
MLEYKKVQAKRNTKLITRIESRLPEQQYKLKVEQYRVDALQAHSKGRTLEAKDLEQRAQKEEAAWNLAHPPPAKATDSTPAKPKTPPTKTDSSESESLGKRSQSSVSRP